MMTIIDTKGKMQHIPVPEEGKQLAVLQAAVGGYVETITLRSGSLLWVNEDGRRLGLPHNPTASIIAGQPIVGSVVLTEKGAIK